MKRSKVEPTSLLAERAPLKPNPEGLMFGGQARAVPDSGSPEVPDPQAPEVPDSGTSEVPDPQSPEVAKSGTSEVADSRSPQAPESATSGLSESVTPKVRKPGSNKGAKSGSSRARKSRSPEVQDSGSSELPKYQTLERKEARLRQDQILEIARLRTTLSRKRVERIERITDNTLLRIAVDLLLAHADQLAGDTEEELHASVVPRGR